MASPDAIGNAAPIYHEQTTFVRRSVQLLAVSFLVLSAPQPVGTIINPPIASVTIAALNPSEIDSSDPLPVTSAPTYVQVEVPYRNNWIARSWMLVAQSNIGTTISIPSASIALNTYPPTSLSFEMWLRLPSDDGWWPEEVVTWKVNASYNFDLLAAPTTAGNVQVFLPSAAVTLTGLPPNAVASGGAVTISVPFGSIATGTFPPAISTGNPTLAIPVAQILLTPILPYLPLPLNTPLAAITISVYPPTIYTPPPGFRVQAVTAGYYNGVFYNAGDVFDILKAGDFSDSTVNYEMGGGIWAVGWMTQVPLTTPLYNAEIQALYPFYPFVDPNRRFVL